MLTKKYKNTKEENVMQESPKFSAFSMKKKLEMIQSFEFHQLQNFLAS